MFYIKHNVNKTSNKEKKPPLYACGSSFKCMGNFLSVIGSSLWKFIVNINLARKQVEEEVEKTLRIHHAVSLCSCE